MKLYIFHRRIIGLEKFYFGAVIIVAETEVKALNFLNEYENYSHIVYDIEVVSLQQQCVVHSYSNSLP